VGVEFLGVGVATNIIQTDTQMRALRFKPQRSGEVDEIAVYSGASTNNPLLSGALWAGHRKPFMVELIPASGFDPGGVHTITTYFSTITASAGVVDEVGTAPEGNELQALNDGLHLFQSGSTPATATVHIPSASAFALDRHIISIAIETGSFRLMNIRRIDQNSTYLWTRAIQGNVAWHMGEAYLEAGDTANWRIWQPRTFREFTSGTGNRRLRYDALNTQSNTLDRLRVHVDHIPERRAGVAIIEPPGSYQWVSGTMFNPMATGSAATVLAGQEYIVLVRNPGGSTDYGGSGSFDWRALKDKRPDGSDFQHYTFLDWDLHDVVLWEPTVPRLLGEQLDGLPTLRMINNGVQTVDTQPYSGSNSGTLPQKTDSSTVKRPRQRLTIPAGTTEYSAARVVVALLTSAPNAPVDRKYVDLDLVDSADSVIAGPFQITEAMWQASPKVGNDLYNDEYREVLVQFGSGIDLPTGDIRARFTLASDYGEPGKTNNIWRIGALVAEITATGHGDQTADGAATGHAFIPPTNGFLALQDTTVRYSDLLVSLLSQAPEITGLSVEQLVQPVTGGVCDPCEPFTTPVGCAVTGIPYHQVCWSPTTLFTEDFLYYEIQRMEHGSHDEDWSTVAIIAPTGTAATGVPASGYVPNCWDDWSHAYDREVCYRVRQRRADGAYGDFVEEVCMMSDHPAGADIVITAPDDPALNVAFPEVHGASLPISKNWTNLDAESHVIRAVYGRDKHIAFRPLERLGLRFQRQVLIAGLCTPEVPCLDVTMGLHDICHAPVSTLVVRDSCGNRWYATVNVPSFTQLHDPNVGDIWMATVEVTELATPIISGDTLGVDTQ
jgi:hypothetical protein